MLPIRTLQALALAMLLAPVAPARAADAPPPDAGPSEAVAEAPVIPPAPLPLDWCVARAEAANPTLAMASAGAEAARARIVPAGALDDPRLRYEASNVPVGDLDFDSTPLSGHQFVLSQKLPPPGLLGAREDAARAEARAAAEGVTDRHLRIRAGVEHAWAELGYAQRALAITRRNVDLVRQLARITESRYAVGGGLQQDVLRAQVELTGLLDQRLRREAELRQAEARLAELLDLPPSTELPATADLEQQAPVPALAPLLAALDAESPRLAALRAEVEAAERGRRAAELEGWPDVDLGLGYRIRQRVAGDPVDGDDFLMAGLTLRLPVNRHKWREHVAEADAMWRRARAAWRAERAMLRAQVRAAHADLVRTDAELELLRTGLVPQARQNLDASRTGYEVDTVDFPSLIDGQVRLLDAELRLVRALADRRAAFGTVEASVGEVLR